MTHAFVTDADQAAANIISVTEKNAARFGNPDQLISVGYPSAQQKASEAMRDLGGAAEKSLGEVPGSGFFGGIGKLANTVLSGIFGGSNTVGFGPETGDTSKLKVSLRSARSDFRLGEKTNDMVIFEAQPTFADTRTAEYETTKILHHPGQMAVYKTTSLRSFTFNFVLFSRNEEEAATNHRYIRLIKSWVMPKYGQTQLNLGAPPEILYLSGLGTILGNFGYGGAVERIPVVLQTYNFDFSEVTTDYISTGLKGDEHHFQPMPIVLKGSITVMEAYSPDEMKAFNLAEFTSGEKLANGDRSAFSKTNSAAASGSSGGAINTGMDALGGLATGIGNTLNAGANAIAGAVTGMMGIATDAPNNVKNSLPMGQCTIGNSAGDDETVELQNSDSYYNPATGQQVRI